MKTSDSTLKRVIASTLGVGVFLVAAIGVAIPPQIGAQDEPASRCGGPVEPKCATVEACRGIFWWKKCVTRSIYFPEEGGEF